MIGSSSGPWSFFRRDPSPAASRHSIPVQGSQHAHLPIDRDDAAAAVATPDSVDHRSSLQGQNPTMASTPSAPTPMLAAASGAAASRLHSLTERKLEKAVLGRSVGLRQLVLLSNTFASRSASAFDDEELEPGIVDLEDEMERKRREEDWLDSVLDEMLTDENDDVVDEQEYYHQHQTNTSGDRDLREPYVHVSLKDYRTPQVSNTSASSAPPSSPPQRPCIPYYTSSGYPLFSIYPATKLPFDAGPVADSGYLEPALVPLPPSPERSPHFRATSAETVDIDNDISRVENEPISSQDLQLSAEICDALVKDLSNGDDRFRLPLPTYADVNEQQSSAPIDIEQSFNSPYSLYNQSTPELAYSVNSFFSNVSSSPSASIHLATPASSPPVPFPARKLEEFTIEEERMLHHPRGRRGEEQEAEDAIEYSVIPFMEGLDMEDQSFRDDSERDRASTKSHSSSDLQDDEDISTGRLSPSMDLIRYQPPISSFTLNEDAFRMARSGVLSPATSLAASRPLPTVPSLARLPSPLLSTILGRETADVESTTTSSRSARDSTGFHLPPPEKLRLPIFLPYEVVKTLYDSVDFGIPPQSTFIPSSLFSAAGVPPSNSSSLPGVLFTSSDAGRSASPMYHHRRDTSRSCPSTPRTRSKSLSKVDAVQYDSSGSLLFSSLGLYDNAHDQNRHDDAFHRFKYEMNGFGRGIVNEWEKRPSSANTNGDGQGSSMSSPMGQQRASRTDSRSPSRLRLPLHPEDGENDFEFGSI